MKLNVEGNEGHISREMNQIAEVHSPTCPIKSIEVIEYRIIRIRKGPMEGHTQDAKYSISASTHVVYTRTSADRTDNRSARTIARNRCH